MNDQFPALHRRIDPAIELPFSLGRVTAIPASLELSCDGAAQGIELRMMQVLIALHQRIGDAVSRDELSLLCWEGRIVGDDALNRIISRLRRALSVDPAIVIDTIPKVGYRLRIDGADRPAMSGPTRRRHWPLSAGGAALLGIILAFVVSGFPGDVHWSAQTMRPLTRDAGMEIHPALSPDGRQLAYAWSADSGAPPDIYLRGTALGETRPVRLTATPAVEISPRWSPDGSQLAFIRQNGERTCEIVVIAPPDSAERSVGRCRQALLATIDWLDARTIVYSDGPVDGPSRLFTLAVASGESRPLTSPPGRLLGDSAPAVSHDGRFIAFRRTVTPGSDDILVFDRETGAVRPLGIGGWKAIGFAWGPDSRTLFLTSNRGGDFGLWSVDTRRDAAPSRISYGIVGLGQISTDRNGNLAIEAVRTRANLFAFSPGGQASPLTSAEGNDWEPDVAADGSIAFGSDVSGSPQLWVKRPEEEPVRLTQLAASYVYSARWSPNGRRIAFIGVEGGRNEIFTVEADGSRLRRLTADGLNKGNLAWAGPSELLYTAELEDGWRVISLHESGEARAVRGGEGLVTLRRAADGALFGRGLDAPIVRLQYSDGRIARAPTGLGVPIAAAWAPAGEGIYWADALARGQHVIRFTAWGGQSRAIAQIQAHHQPALALRAADGAIVAPRITEASADLILFELKQN